MARAERIPNNDASVPGEVPAPAIERNTLRTIHSGGGYIVVMSSDKQSTKVVHDIKTNEAVLHYATPSDILLGRQAVHGVDDAAVVKGFEE